jgi:hypothetical protein
MKRRPDRKALRRAVELAAENPFFLASALEAYRSFNSLDDAALAAHLGCSLGDLPRLALCRRPGLDPTMFRKEVEHIASYGSVQAERLAQLIREVESLEALQSAERSGATTSGQGLLMAARDRADEGKDTTEEARKKQKLGKDPGQGQES